MESKGGALLVTGGEEDLPVSDVHRVLGAPVVEARFAPHVEQDLAAHALDPPNQHPPLVKRRPSDGHEVRHLGDAGSGEPSRDQNVGVRYVQLLLCRTGQVWCDKEPAAAAAVEQGSEDGSRVEARERHEVDRAVLADKCDGVHVADQPVVLDRLVAGSDHAGTPIYRRCGVAGSLVRQPQGPLPLTAWPWIDRPDPGPGIPLDPHQRPLSRVVEARCVRGRSFRPFSASGPLLQFGRWSSGQGHDDEVACQPRFFASASATSFCSSRQEAWKRETPSASNAWKASTMSTPTARRLSITCCASP